MCGLAGGAARASQIEVPAGDGLGAAVARAAPGDVLHLAPGLHRGAVAIATPGVTLQGAAGAIIDGGGTGNALTVTAPDTVLRGLTIRGSGMSLIGKNSGVFLGR